MTRAVLEIARHELLVLLRTRRALAMLVMYLGAALAGGGLYVLSVRAIEEQVRAVLAESRGAALIVDLAGNDAYRKLAAAFSGTAFDAMSPTLSASVILPVVLWCSLAFLPFLVLLTSFDILAADLRTRTLCYSVLRAPRAAIVLGRVAAHGLALVVLVGLSSATLVFIAAASLESETVVSALPGLVRVWLLLLPFVLCYLGIACFASASRDTPMTVLLVAFGTTIALRMCAWLDGIPESSPWRPLAILRYLSPATHHAGMWHAGFVEPLGSAAAYLTLAAAFVWLAVRRLERQDL